MQDRLKSLGLVLFLSTAAAAAPAQKPADQLSVMKYLNQSAPEVYRELEIASVKNPKTYEAQMRLLIPMYKDTELRDVFFRSLKISYEVRSLSAKLRNAKASESAAIKDSLRKALSAQFDAKLELQGVQLNKLLAGIAAQKEEIKARRAKKAVLVEKRLSAIVNAQESGDW